MRRASITETKNNLSALIDGVKAGSPVLIVDRGHPVARLEPVTGSLGEQDGRLSRLFRDGLVRPRRTAPPRGLFMRPPPGTDSGVSIVDLLLDERREGR